MRRSTLLRLVATVGAVALVWLSAPVVRLVLDEAAVPSNRAARAVPGGVDIVSSDVECGSGGCWRDLTLRWPGHPADELRARLGLGPAGSDQLCRAASLVDRRQACVGVDEVLASQPGAPDLLRVETWWHRPAWR